MLVLMVTDIQVGGFYHNSIIPQNPCSMYLSALANHEDSVFIRALSSSLAFGIGQRMHPHSRAFHPDAHLGTGRTRGFPSNS